MKNYFLTIYSTAFLLLTSCTLQKFIISHGDFLLKRELKSYVKLTSDQETKLDLVVEKLWKNLKQKESLIFIETLNSIVKLPPMGTTEQKYNQFVEQISIFSLFLWTTYGYDFSAIIHSLSDKQIIELEEKFLESNKELQEKLAWSDEKYNDNEIEKNHDRYESWYGSMTEMQEKILSQHIPSKMILQKRLNSRISAQQQFLKFLRTKPTITQIQNQFAIWIQSPELLRDEEYRADYFATSTFFKSNFLLREMAASENQKQYSQNRILQILTDLHDNFSNKS